MLALRALKDRQNFCAICYLYFFPHPKSLDPRRDFATLQGLGRIVMRPLILIALVCSCLLPSAESSTLDRLVAAQADRTAAIGQLDRSITQVAFPNEPPVHYQVSLWLQAPNQYRIRFERPDDEGSYDEFLSDGETRWMAEKLFPEDPPEITAKPVRRDGGLWQTFNKLFPLNPEALAEDFHLEAKDTETGARLRLVPKAGELSEHLQYIELSFSQDNALTEFHYLDRDGNREDWQIRELRYPESISATVFSPEWQPQADQQP